MVPPPDSKLCEVQSTVHRPTEPVCTTTPDVALRSPKQGWTEMAGLKWACDPAVSGLPEW